MEKREQNPGDRGWTALASVETTSTFGELNAAVIHSTQQCRFEWAPTGIAPGSAARYDLYVDSADPNIAACTGRSLLAQLTDAADRGMLTGFRIVRGAELLLHPSWKDGVPEPARQRCDETSRAAQPDIATGGRRWSAP